MDTSTSIPKENKKRHYCCVCSNYRGKSVDNKTIILHKFPAYESLKKSWIRCIKILMPQFAYNKHDRLCSAYLWYGKYTKEHNIPLIFNIKSKIKIDFEESNGQTTLKTTCCSEQISLKFNDYLGAVEVSEHLFTTVGTHTDDNHCSCRTNGRVMQVASSTDIQINQTKSIGIQVIRPDIAFEDISDSNEKFIRLATFLNLCVALANLQQPLVHDNQHND
ncbi:hypothetical protein ACJMK2_026113 [Sinanodonta woodiana]|uniref:THAP-type domain-containing protein n=1 Tax=Sinanodonta woodiana TaxID=1069815 RepID=A0ABD3XM93_SINWO